MIAWDHTAERAIAASAPSNHAFGRPNALRLESCHPTSARAFEGTGHADRAATLLQETLEARNKTGFGQSTVRPFRAGTTFQLMQSAGRDCRRR